MRALELDFQLALSQYEVCITLPSTRYVVSEPDPNPKGEGESGTVAYIAICSPHGISVA